MLGGGVTERAGNHRRPPPAQHARHLRQRAADGTDPGRARRAAARQPARPAPEDPTNPPLYDYANDSYLEPTPDTDKGVQIRRDDTSGCHYKPTGTTNPESQVHRWVTDPMATAFMMTGKGDARVLHPNAQRRPRHGQLCIYLFKRHELGSPPVATRHDADQQKRRHRLLDLQTGGNAAGRRNWTRSA